MKTIKWILRGLTVLILLVLIAIVILVRNLSTRAIPDYNADVKLTGLTEPVEVYRDAYGVPHIYAENELDLYRVTGYLMAQDRLWQMDLIRRATSGRLSEILGKDMIGADQLFRSLRIEEKSRLVAEKTDPFILSCIEAYADGINQYITQNSGKLSFEFKVLGYEPEPWEVNNSFDLISYMSWDLSTGWDIESMLYKVSRVVDEQKFLELIPDLDIQEAIFPQFMLEEDLEPVMDLLAESDQVRKLGVQVFDGSNNWVVDGKRSSTGKPLVSNDMHLDLDMAPGIWYQMHHYVPGKVHVTGVALPGAPFIIAGHNDSIAWGMTNVMVDDMDFYLETLNTDTSQYLLDGQWRDLEIVEEKIRVKGGETVTRTNRFTHRGPIISSFKGIEDRAISMRWTGNEYSNEPRTVYLFNRAANLDDFRDAAKTFISTSQNIVYGDMVGNIGMFTCAGVPIRPGNRAFVMPGDTSLYDWQGLVPFELLPHEVNPEHGFLISANNRTTGPDYPFHISHWYILPHRYNRIHELLSEKDIYTPVDMERIQADQTSSWVKKIMDVSISELDGSALEGTAAMMYETFREWDGNLSRNAVEATLFEAFYIQLLEAIFLDELGENLYGELLKQDLVPSYVIDRCLEGQEISWCDDISTSETEAFADLIVPSWNATIEWLSDNYGDDPSAWEWGKLHQISFTHPMGSVNLLKKVFKLERGPYAVGGSYHTVSPYSYVLGQTFRSNHGSSHRHVFSTGDWDDSRVIIPTGVSGIPASDFYCNQTEMYINNEYMTELFSRESVLENAAFKSISIIIINMNRSSNGI